MSAPFFLVVAEVRALIGKDSSRGTYQYDASWNLSARIYLGPPASTRSFWNCLSLGCKRSRNITQQLSLQKDDETPASSSNTQSIEGALGAIESETNRNTRVSCFATCQFSCSRRFAPRGISLSRSEKSGGQALGTALCLNLGQWMPGSRFLDCC